MYYQTEEPTRPVVPEEKLAHAVLARAYDDIVQYDEVETGKIKISHLNRNARRHIACDAIAFFFARKSRIRDYWLQVSGLRLEAVREHLLKRYPWILTL